MERTNMKLKDFMKYYYNKTLCLFPDKIKYRGRAINVCKKDRKQAIIMGYSLLVLWITFIPLLFLFKELLALLLLMVGFLCLPIILILEADFNILTIICCYRIYKKKNIYSEMLVKSWFVSGKIHLIFQQNLNVKGMQFRNMREGFFSNKFRRKYCLPFRDNKSIVFIIKSDNLTVYYNNIKKTYTDQYSNVKELFTKIRYDFEIYE
ncbi:MAG: hypothetical protein IJX78_05795 [Bacilli bacterium]|nr:hypothetical protein [Bacilli bacterium]